MNLQTAADAMPGTAPVRFVGGDAGAIDVIGTTLGQANLSLVGADVGSRSGASAMTIDGSPLRLDVGSLNLSGGASLGTSAEGHRRHNQIEADTLYLNAGNIRTVASGGQGGRLKFPVVHSWQMVELSSLFRFGSHRQWQSGAVSISMTDSIRGAGRRLSMPPRTVMAVCRPFH